jgi:hypothetical protein
MYVVINMIRIVIAIVLYIAIITILVIAKPSIMFNSKNEIKKWGIERDEDTSIFSPMIVFPIIAMICYYIASLVELI